MSSLPAKEKQYWHYHKDEIGRACTAFPNLTKEESCKILPAVHATYGKVIYFRMPEDRFPLGEPYILNVHETPGIKK